MEIEFNSSRKSKSKKGGKITAGDVSYMLTGGKLEAFFKRQKVHPEVIRRLHGAGFFDSIVDNIKKATKFIIDNKDNIKKGIEFGKQAVEAGKQGYDLYKSFQKGGIIGNCTLNTGLSRFDKEVLNRIPKKPVAGKLNPEMRKRANAMGNLMTGKRFTMAEASAIYKIMKQGYTEQEAIRKFMRGK